MLKKSQFAKLSCNMISGFMIFITETDWHPHDIEKCGCCVYPWNRVRSVTWTKEYKQVYGGNVSILFIFHVIHMSHVVYVM